MTAHRIFIFALFLCFTYPVFAKPKTEEEAQKIIESLKWQTSGSIPLKDVAAVQLKDGFRYLDPTDATKVLSDLWGNPPEKTLGMIFPPEDANKGGWGVIIEGFNADGYVKDEEADKLDASKMLKEMQDAQREANADRKAQGFSELEIVNWAVPPRYDKETKKLFWAIDIRAVGSDRHSVNYFIRVLGRRGYLVLNALGGLEQVQEIESATPNLLSMVEFKEGHRYADFDASKGDKVAAYGIAGLIMGAVGLKAAAKLGLLALLAKKFGVILLFLKKGAVVIVAFFAVLYGKVKSFFAGRRAAGGAGDAPLR